LDDSESHAEVIDVFMMRTGWKLMASKSVKLTGVLFPLAEGQPPWDFVDRSGHGRERTRAFFRRVAASSSARSSVEHTRSNDQGTLTVSSELDDEQSRPVPVFPYENQGEEKACLQQTGSHRAATAAGLP
jgi:hypothetical protein